MKFKNQEIFNGKKVLLTGGTGHLGRVVAKAFLESGASVASSYLRSAGTSGISRDLMGSMLLVRSDVTSEDQVVALFAAVKKKFGTLDILINLVGGYLPTRKLVDLETKNWDAMLAINLRSMFLCSREFLKSLPNYRYGRIISMSAIPAITPSAGRGSYAVSKSGVSVLTKVLGEELKGTGVTSNAIAPSIIRTQPNMEAMPTADFDSWVSPEDIASTMIYLCTNEAGAINGLTIPMVGGVTIE